MIVETSMKEQIEELGLTDRDQLVIVLEKLGVPHAIRDVGHGVINAKIVEIGDANLLFLCGKYQSILK